MRTEGNRRLRKPMAKHRFMVLVLVLTLVAFGVIGALVVTLQPSTERLQPPEQTREAPRVRQLDRESLHRDKPAPGH